MVVQARDKHPGLSGSIGLYVGVANAEQHFPREFDYVELELDHLQIVCTLEASFWQDRPEIYDSRLSSWLESKRNSGKMAPQDAQLTLTPRGRASFRVEIAASDDLDSPITAPPSRAYFEPAVSPISLLDRRKHKLAARVERRRVAKLESDERLSPAASN